MKVVDYPKNKATQTRKFRRDRPDEPLMFINLGLPETLWRRLEQSAKSNCRTVAQEARFRIIRDLAAEDKSTPTL
jgi:hypothetical protein